MKKILKVLAVYTILISLFAIGANFILIGQKVSINSRMALIVLIIIIPVLIFSGLVIFHSRKKKEETEE